jgi:hypothetical protein
VSERPATTAYVHCYIGEGAADPDALVAFARSLHDGFHEVEELSAGHLLVIGDAGCLTISEVSPQRNTPFRFSVDLSIFRPEKEQYWLAVRFARDVAESTHSTVYCNVPPEIRQDEDDFFQIRFTHHDRQLTTELVELDDRDQDTVLELSSRTIDLSTYSGFTNPPDYEFPHSRQISPR